MKSIVATILLIFSPAALPVAPPLGQFAQIAQSSDRIAAPTKDIRTITFCRDVENMYPHSASNSFSPISVNFLRQIGARHDVTIDELKPYRVTLVTPPQHGQVSLVYGPSHHWSYAPTDGYTGADRAIYLVEAQGKRYKVVVNFWVLDLIDENREIQECNSKKFGR